MNLRYLTEAELAEFEGEEALPFNVVPPGWQALTVDRNGESVAVMIYLGTEVHIGVRPGFEGKVLSRKALRELAAPILDKWGFLTTKLPLESEHEQRFIERIGFRKTWSSDEFDYFILTTQPYERRK